ncbi:MAG: Nramp family divalent metal transporter [Flavobacteriales bacterium]|nr:Nramp family divalent metal transporter [Flavobacteriales bacterium]
MKNLLKTLGPGILFASTAIGVSHLIQSTQAGGNFGFTMLWAVVLANLFKYPFFEFGSRYANATGKSIIDGYGRLGKPALHTYLVITLISMFLVTSAVGNVTAGFMQNLFGIESTILPVILIFVVSVGILISGSFKLLDSLIKVVGIVLLLSTLAAFILVLIKGPQGDKALFSMSEVPMNAYIALLIPLMGWMPTAVDLSSWNSLWTVERIKQTNYHPKLKETLFDFNFGYISSALLAICFVTLGAFLMYGTGQTFEEKGAQFAAKVIELYTSTFGDWANIIISASAFSIMFGTCVAVFDGYSRAFSETIRVYKQTPDSTPNSTSLYRWTLVAISLGSFLIIYIFQSYPAGFIKLVILATTISFLMAPVIAIFNFKLVQEKFIGKEFVPSKFIRLLAYLGIIFLSVFSILYLIYFFNPEWVVSLLTS